MKEKRKKIMGKLYHFLNLGNSPTIILKIRKKNQRNKRKGDANLCRIRKCLWCVPVSWQARGVSCYWCPTLTDNRGACPPRGATERLILLTPFHVQMLCLDLGSETRYIGGRKLARQGDCLRSAPSLASQGPKCVPSSKS